MLIPAQASKTFLTEGKESLMSWIIKLLVLIIIGSLILIFVLVDPLKQREKKVVTLWHTETEPQSLKAMGEIIQDFEKIHPDIQVEQIGIPWDVLESRLLTAIGSGNPPDVTHGQPITCAFFYAKKLLRSLDDIIVSIGEDNIWNTVRKIGLFDDQYYGIAHAASISFLIYRKDLFKQKGLTPPKTWEDFLKVLETLTEDTDGNGQIDRYGLGLPGTSFFVTSVFDELLHSNNGRLFDSEGNPTLTEKPVLELLEFYKRLLPYLPPDWFQYSYLDTFAALASGKVALIYAGYGRGVRYIEQYAPKEMANPEHFGVLPKPIGPSGILSIPHIDAELWMIFKEARYPEEAAEFLKFFYRDENYLKYVQSAPIQLFPITKSLRNHPKYQENEVIQKWDEWLAIQESYFDNDLARPLLIRDWEDLRKPFLLEVLDSKIISELVLDVTLRGLSPAEAASKAQTSLKRLLFVGGYRKE